MPPIPKPGQIIHGYQIVKHMHKGAMANSFEALDTHNGNRKVFFKAYISPTPALDWFEDYIKYVHELDERLDNPAVRIFCVKTIDQFKAPLSSKSSTKFFFQVFDFIEGGHDLESLMERAREYPEELPWQTRLTMAKVFIAGLKNLHSAKVVHADLKPANIQMLPDPGTKIGFKPRLIDMDFSLLDDKTAPWDGKVGYVGTPSYYSPEHLNTTPGHNIPRLHSDIFTSGIILCELLAGRHPFAGRCSDMDEYRDAVMANDHVFREHGLELPELVNDSEEDTHILGQTILDCLSPLPADRPDAAILHQALLGTLVPDASTSTSHDSGHEKTAPRKETGTGAVLIKGDMGTLKYAQPGTVGRAHLGTVSSEAKYANHEQFQLLKGEDGHWWIFPCDGTSNWTVVNGNILTEPILLEGETNIELQSRTTDRKAMTLVLGLI